MGPCRAILLGLMLCGDILCCPAATAQPARGAEGPSLPDVGDVIGAYLKAREWVSAFDAPRSDDDASRIPLRGAGGAAVILRHKGRVVGTGSDLAADEFMLRRAIGRAMTQALGDPVIAGLDPALRGTIGGALTLELDVAGTFMPLPGRTFGQITGRVDPAVDGLALRRGRQWATTFPSHMLASNIGGDGVGVLRSLAAQLGLPALDLAELERQGDVTVYRFRTIHLAQADPRAFPHQASRADELVLPEEATLDGVKHAAAALVAHIGTRKWRDPDPTDSEPAPPGLMGDYRPVADDYEPIAAPLLDLALTSFALLRYAATESGALEGAEQARELGLDILRDFTRLDLPLHTERDDPATTALLVYALCEVGDLDGHPELGALLESALMRLRESVTTKGTVHRLSQGPEARQINAHEQALVTGAMARALSRGLPGSPSLAIIQAAIDKTWDMAPEPEHISLLPWIGWAEADLATGQVGPAERSTRLDRLRGLLEASRIQGGPDTAPDLVGGLALTAAEPGSPPRATAQCLRPAAWLAGLLADRSGLDEEAGEAALEGHQALVRFILQLTVRDGSEWRFRSPRRCLGGIRAAPWDVDQPLAAQAMGLLTLAETIRALEGPPGGQNRP